VKRVARYLLLGWFLLAAGCGGDDRPKEDARATGPATLLFAASEGGRGWDIYVENVVTGTRTNLTNTPSTATSELDDRSPTLSPDGSMIAYTSTADNPSDGLVGEEIFVMRRDGSKQRRLTDDDDVDVQPQWTPKGRIFFTNCPSSQEAVPGCGLDLILPDGSGRQTIVGNIGLAFGVSLSPGGDRIAYAGLDETLQPLGLFVRRLDSAEGERIGEGGSPQWSPDGDRIAFLSERDENGRCLFRECVGHAPELYLVDADGSSERRLTETSAVESFAGWTPDGEWILFSRIRDEEDDYDVYAVRADGSCEVQVTDTEAWEWSASWSGSTESLDC